MSAGITTPSTEASEEFPSRIKESPNRRFKSKTRSRTRSKSRQGSRTPGRESMYMNNNNYDDGFNHFNNGNSFNNFNRPPVNKNLIINTGQYHPLTPFNLNMKNNNNINNNNVQPNSQFAYSQEQQQPIFHSPHYAQQHQQQQQQQQLDAMYPYGRFDGMYVNVDVARNGGNTPLSNPMASPFDPQYGNFLIPSNLMTPYSATGNGHNASYFDSYSEQRFPEDNENNYVGDGPDEQEEEEEGEEEFRHSNQGRNGDHEHIIINNNNNNNHQQRLNFQNQYQNQDNSFFNKQNSGNSRIRNKFNNKMEILKTNKRKISNTNNLVSTKNDLVGSILNENLIGASNELETCLRILDTAVLQSDNGEPPVAPEIQFQYFIEEDDNDDETGLSNTSSEGSDQGLNLLLKDLKGDSNFLMVLAADNLLYSKTLTNCIQFTVDSGDEKENKDENTSKNIEKNYILSFIDELHCLKFHNKLLKNLNNKSKSNSKKNFFGDLIIENCKIKNFINGVPINNVQNNRSLMIKYRMGLDNESDKDIKVNDIINEIKSKISNTSIIVLKIDVFDYLETESFIVLTFANYNMKYLFTRLCEEDSILKMFNVDFQHELHYSAMSEISNLEKTLGDIQINELKRTKKNDKNMYTINSNEYPESFIEHHTSMIFSNFEILSPCFSDNELVLTSGKNSSRNNSKIINNHMRASGLVNRVSSPSAEQAEEINNVISNKVLSEIISEELNDVETNSSLVVNRVSSTGNLMDAADVGSAECPSDDSDVGEPSEIRIDICPEADDTFHHKRQVLSSGSSSSSNCDPLYQPLEMNGVNALGHWGQPGPPPPLPMPSALGIHVGGPVPVPVPVQVPMHMSMSLPMPPPMTHATNMSSPMSSPHRRQGTLQRSSGSSSGMNFAYMENVSSQLINIIRMNMKNRVIFISNLPKVCRVEDVCNVVRGGVVQNIKYIKDKCFCFVTFIDPSSAKRFFEHVHVHRNQIILHGYLLDVNYGSRGLQLPPISNKMLLSLSTGACRNIYISLPEFSYKEKYINDAKYEQFQNKYYLPKEKVIRKDFTDYFGELEKINYLNDGHCCWVNFLNITHAIRFMEMLTNEPLKFHALFENRYLGLVIKYGKDRCANNFKTNI